MNILVTGASRGIGKAICDRLKDHNIFTCGRYEETLASYENYCVCDLTETEGIEKLGSYIVENEINVLINNAGEYVYSPVEATSREQIERIIRLDLAVPLYLTSKAVPYMKQLGFGRIINIGSISGVMGEAYASAYSAAKSGLIGATKALALELAPYKITVNTINPGWVNTDMGNASANEGGFSKEELVECIPQKRFVSPKEIAGMVKYLISEDAKGVTGQSINLCAGLTCGC